ncbi:hypothetical protein EWM64_g5843 [Hericium alpestre]|uniref:Cytochrome P450 n=1 Tax=Hericium alpestre TaxID=135208 RepID=A0A4Y9ZVA2_9AGAM|nr:hypothetical protein EWM64_g5843 [Hericium alpestre]
MMASSAAEFIILNPLLIPGFLFTLYFISNATYQLFFSPIRGIPGPWYAAISDLWLITETMRFRSCKSVHWLFEAYGPIVRVGPNSVVFHDYKTAKDVYKFDKGEKYKALRMIVGGKEHDHAMTTLGRAEHAVKRKAFAPHYTAANLVLFQPEFHQCILELTSILRNIEARVSVDCLDLFHQLLYDITSRMSFNTPSTALAAWSRAFHDQTSAKDPVSEAVGHFPKFALLRGNTPRWVWNILRQYPNQRWRQFCDCSRIMEIVVNEEISATRSATATKFQSDSTRDELNDSYEVVQEKIPLLERLLRSDVLSDSDVTAEMTSHLIAALDTSATMLSFLCWELSRRPDVVQNLRAELANVASDAGTIPPISELNKLPYLNAFVREGLRIYGAGPGTLERVVPASSTPFDILGHVLPPGTIVATQAWTSHRDPSIFPASYAFEPGRWLDGDIAAMTAQMMPFGLGTRICGGMHLAQMTLRMVIVEIVRNFEVSAAPETTEASMEICHSFVRAFFCCWLRG